MTLIDLDSACPKPRPSVASDDTLINTIAAGRIPTQRDRLIALLVAWRADINEGLDVTDDYRVYRNQDRQLAADPAKAMLADILATLNRHQLAASDVALEAVQEAVMRHLGVPHVNRSVWVDADTWRDPDCIECGGEGAPCCDPPDGPPPAKPDGNDVPDRFNAAAHALTQRQFYSGAAYLRDLADITRVWPADVLAAVASALSRPTATDGVAR